MYWGIGGIACLTLPPLGENLASGRNRRREELNRRIRSAVDEAGALLIDAAAAFETALEEIPVPSDYFFSDPSEYATDARRLRKDKGAMRLSEERGLYFTMDGAHLNERGAQLLGTVIREGLPL